MEEKRNSGWIDVHNDDVMRKMGFDRPFDQTPRDKDVWTKTDKEKEAVRIAKRLIKKGDWHFHNFPKKRGMVKSKLIIQLKPNKIFPKNTYSMIRMDNQIEDALARFKVTNPKTGYVTSLVSEYYFNGKTYKE